MGVCLTSQLKTPKSPAPRSTSPGTALPLLPPLPGPLPSFQLIWAPGLGAALLPDELCSFRLKKKKPPNQTLFLHLHTIMLFLKSRLSSFSWRLSATYQMTILHGQASSLAKSDFTGLYFKDIFFFMQHILNLDP